MAEIYRPDKSYPANLTPGYRRIPMKGGTKIELGHAVSVVAGFAKIPAAADDSTASTQIRSSSIDRARNPPPGSGRTNPTTRGRPRSPGE